jgi:hypothetical protein
LLRILLLLHQLLLCEETSVGQGTQLAALNFIQTTSHPDWREKYINNIRRARKRKERQIPSFYIYI